VYNGLALDKNGQLIRNEQQVNDSRVYTLLGINSTFYIEIEFAESESDVDARAFWDPTYSGNTPKGKEFSLNVSTRITPDWKIVTPVSTVGFQVTTNPDSTRIPIAVLSTNSSNVITSVLAKASTVLEEDRAALSTSMRVLDSSLFPDTGTLSVGSEAGLSFVSNDRSNNILTLAGAGLASDKQAGSIVVNSGAISSSFVVEDAQAIPTTTDRRNILFKGDEIRGSAIASSKYTAGERDDLDIKSIKDLVDFQAAQIREMKFGSLRSDEVNSAPPNTFLSTRYYDYAGSITGARTSTVTIGDGEASFGDFNGVTLATSIENAHNSMSSDGGSIYVKAGYYRWDKDVILSQPTTIVFDKGVMFTSGSYSGTLNFSGNHAYKVVGLPDMLSYYPFYLYFNDPIGLNLTLDNCVISRLWFGASATNVSLYVKDSKVSLTTGGAIGAISLGSVGIVNAVFDNTTIEYNRASDSSSSYLILGDMLNTEFRNCKFDIAKGAGSCGGYLSSTGTSCSNVKFFDCTFGETTDGKATKGLEFESTTTISDVVIRDCLFDFHWGANPQVPSVLYFNSQFNIADIIIEGCNFEAIGRNLIPNTSIGTPGNIIHFKALNKGHGIVCSKNLFGKRPINTVTIPGDFVQQITTEFGQTSGSVLSDIQITDNVFNSFYRGIAVLGILTKAVISNNVFNLSASASDLAVSVTAIYNNDTTSNLVVSNNSIEIRTGNSLNVAQTRMGIDVAGRVVATGNDIFIRPGTASCVGINVNSGSITCKALLTGNTIDIETSGNSVSSCIGIKTNSTDDHAEVNISSNNIKLIKDAGGTAVGISSVDNKTSSPFAETIISTNRIYVEVNDVVSGAYGVEVSSSGTSVIGNTIDIFSDNSITNVTARNINVSGGFSIVINANTLSNSFYSGNIVYCSDVRNDMSICNNAIIFTSLFAHCINLEVVADSVTGIKVSDNSIKWSNSGGNFDCIRVYIEGDLFKALAISNNLIYGATGPLTASATARAIYVYQVGTTTHPMGVNIIGNTYSGVTNSTARGISSGAISTNGIDYVSINSNNIIGWIKAGGTTGTGIYVQQSALFCVVGNLVEASGNGTTPATIELAASNSYGLVDSNTILNGNYDANGVGGVTIGTNKLV
jgi:hypothetical protein